MTDSPLQAAMQAAGGVTFSGTTPRNFGDAAREYDAARSGAAVFDFSNRAQIELSGADRAKFLHNFCTNDVQRLAPGEGCEAFVTNVKGRVLGHIFVFAGPNSICLDMVAGAEEALLAHLEKYLITEDVELADRSAEWGALFVSGPEAERRCAAVGLEPGLSTQYAHGVVACEGHDVFARRLDLLGATGYELVAPRDVLPELFARLVAAGCTAAGTDAFEPLRIEAGYPLFGVDYGDENLAQEVARTEQCISFTKGCYLGQEPIARIDALGHVNRELRRLRLETDRVPEPQTPVSPPGGEHVGAITSAARVPGRPLVFAWALVRSQYTQPGTTLDVSCQGETTNAVVL